MKQLLTNEINAASPKTRSLSEQQREPAGHTPGKWFVIGERVDFEDRQEAITFRRGNIALVDGRRPKENLANACLIAAAPELLEACKLMLEVRDPCYPGAISDREADDIGRTAIAKAEGK